MEVFALTVWLTFTSPWTGADHTTIQRMGVYPTLHRCEVAGVTHALARKPAYRSRGMAHVSRKARQLVHLRGSKPWALSMAGVDERQWSCLPEWRIPG